MIFQIRDNRIAVISAEALPTGTAGTLQAEFQYTDSEWSGLTLKGCFKAGKEGIPVGVPLSDKKCVVPWEVLRIKDKPFYAGLYGYNEAGKLVKNTPWIKVDYVEDGAIPSMDPAQNPELVEKALEAAVADYVEKHPVGVDEEISETSSRPVANKTIAAALSSLSEDKANLSDVERIRQDVANLAVGEAVTKWSNYVHSPMSLTGKSIAFYGDSITAGYTTGTTMTKETYPKLFAQKFGMTAENHATGGARIGTSVNNVMTITQQVKKWMPQTDFVVVAGGVNDWIGGTATTTFENDVRTLCQLLKDNYNGEVIFITPIPTVRESNTSQNAKATLQDYRNIISEVAMQFNYSVVQGHTFNFPTVAGTYSKKMYGDGLHLTEFGYEVFANTLADILTGGESSGASAEGEPDYGDLPKVFFSGDITGMSKTSPKNVEIEYISKTDRFKGYAEMKWQGTSSIYFAKKNFTIKMYEDESHSKKLKKDMKKWGEQSKYCLKANFVDITHSRNIVSARLWAEIEKSRNASDKAQYMLSAPNYGAIDGFPIKLYMNGKYEGIYTWNIPKDDWMFAMNSDNPNHCVLCAESNNNGKDTTDAVLTCEFRKAWNGVDGEGWSVEVGTITDGIVNGFNNFINFVASSTDTEFRSQFGNYANLQSFIDYFVYMIYIAGNDSSAKNMLVTTEDGGATWYATMYDMDSVWGQDQQQSYSATAVYPDNYHDTNSLLWKRIIACFKNEIKARYNELKQTVLSHANVFNHFERFADQIGDTLYAKDQKCGYTLPGTAWNSIDYIEDWTLRRRAYVDTYMEYLGSDMPDVPDDPSDSSTFSITYNLTNATSSNTTRTVANGNAYATTITVADGYDLGSITVRMGGQDITTSVVSGLNINIPSVTGAVGITVWAQEKVANTCVVTINGANANVTYQTGDTEWSGVNNGDEVALGWRVFNVTAKSGYSVKSVTVVDGTNGEFSKDAYGNYIGIASTSGITITIETVTAEALGNGDVYHLASAVTATGSNGSGLLTDCQPNKDASDLTWIVDYQLASAGSYGKFIFAVVGGTNASGGKGISVGCDNNVVNVGMQFGYTTGLKVTDLERHTIAGSLDRTNKIFKIFVDGALLRTVNNANETQWLEASDYYLTIGGGYYANTKTAWCINGTVNHLEIYNGVKSDEQIIAKMQALIA